METRMPRIAGALFLLLPWLIAGCSRPPAPEPAPPPRPAATPKAEEKPDRSSLSHESAPRYTAWPEPRKTERDRLEWNRETLVAAYEEVGTRDARWDDAAREVLEAFADLRSRSASTQATGGLRGLARKAVDAGCPDPMVAYLGLRYLRGSHEEADEALAADYRRVAHELGASRYPVIRKFYVTVRAAQAWKAVYGNTGEAVHEYGPMREKAFGYLVEVLRDPELPVEEGLDATHDFTSAIASSNVQEDEYLPTLVNCLGRRWPGVARAHLLRGHALTQLAWNRRGSGYANSVTAEGWKGFNQHLAAAERDLNEAWRLDPTRAGVAVEMMTVQLGKGADLPRMKLWFNRAMQADPACYEAAHKMAWYLQPKWHGSVQEALEFGRRCVASREWKGRVPLVLADAHLMLANDQATGLRDQYWPQRGVWEDVHASFERFFELNPEAVGFRHDYALYAHKCRQFGAFLDLLPKLGRINYPYFGGREKFERMVAEAAKATGRTPEWPAAAKPSGDGRSGQSRQ